MDRVSSVLEQSPAFERLRQSLREKAGAAIVAHRLAVLRCRLLLPRVWMARQTANSLDKLPTVKQAANTTLGRAKRIAQAGVRLGTYVSTPALGACRARLWRLSKEGGKAPQLVRE